MVTLLEAIEKFSFDACIGGTRRDEEKSWARERIFIIPARIRAMGPQEPAAGEGSCAGARCRPRNRSHAPQPGTTSTIPHGSFPYGGDITCTAPAVSTATTIEEIISETALSTITERGAIRLDDQTSESAMEQRKKEGDF
jgi:sulfate adenylyltransferase subunit 2